MSRFKLLLVVVATAAASIVLPAHSEGSLLFSRLWSFEKPSVIMDISHKSSQRPTIRVTGVITNEGAECTALQGDDGKLYTLAGGAGSLEPGDRVRVIGKVTEVSFCMQGTTLEVRRVIALR